MNSSMTADESRNALVFAGVFEPGVNGGGPIRSLTRIVDTVSDPVVVHVVTRDRDVGERTPYPELHNTSRSRGRHTVLYLDPMSPAGWRLVAGLRRMRRWDVVYVNSLFDPMLSLVPLVLLRLGLLSATSVVIAPRGELSPGALRLKPYKKRPYLWLWRMLVLRDSWVMHASTSREAQEIKAALGASNIIEVEDQVHLPKRAAEPVRHDGPLRLVFISRISPKKNVLAAVQGLAEVSQTLTLDIYGPVEDETYWHKCLTAARELPPNVTVVYRGAIQPDRVVDVLAGYDGFLFPTHGENFGHVVAESLAASCPVLVPDTTPWTPFILQGGGVLLGGTDPGSVAQGVRELSEASVDQRYAARRGAGQAFELWRTSHSDTNVLDAVLSRAARD